MDVTNNKQLACLPVCYRQILYVIKYMWKSNNNNRTWFLHKKSGMRNVSKTQSTRPTKPLCNRPGHTPRQFELRRCLTRRSECH